MDILFAVLLALAPIPVEPKKDVAPPPKASRTLPEKIAWGDVKVDGNAVTITGNSEWTAIGVLTKPDVLHLRWTFKDNARLVVKDAVGIYRCDEITGEWPGAWGWDDEVFITADGELAGAIALETLRKDE